MQVWGKIKKVYIHIRKTHEDREVVAELYKTETPLEKEVIGDLCNRKLNSYDLRGPLQGKNINDLITKMEKEAYVNILTEDNPREK